MLSEKLLVIKFEDLRRDPETVATWAKELPRASTVVAYCVHGHDVSQGVATALNGNGIHLNGRIPNGRGRSKTTAGRSAAAKPRAPTKLTAGATATGQERQALA